MRRERVWSHVSRKLVVLLLAVSVPPAATLVWLGLQLFAQDRTLQDTLASERRRAEAQAVVNALDQAVANAEQQLSGGSLPSGVVRLTFTGDSVTAEPANSALWLPVSRVARPATPPTFADAEALEYGGQIERAVELYEKRAESGSPHTRAGALLRLGRIHRQAGRWEAALQSYRQLATLGDVELIDAPAELQARRAIVSLLESAGRRDEMAREATSLSQDFVGGRWTLDRPAWELTAQDIERWTSGSVDRPPEREAMSEVADRLWVSRATPTVARTSELVGGDIVTVLSRATDDGRVALVISSGAVHAWIPSAAERAGVAAGRVRIVAATQPAATRPTAASTDTTTVAPSATGLPWTIALGPADTAAEAQAFERRRQQLSLALVAILVLLAGGSYFLWRVMQRELAVGRLQTEFVAAVSHEFRTPLTSLRHVTDLLEEGDEIPRERRGALYGALGRNVDRLQRLVESLLDFSRMESGRKPYDLQPVDAAALVTGIVETFRKDGAPEGFTVHLEVDTPGPLMCSADAASLTNALWNLLDNAVKYSPSGREIHVSVRRRPGGLAIAVKDAGLGIPAAEQREIFRRFVRGESARRLGIKGTGLGLAMVAHIARAHRGTVEMESEEGVGSTFRIVLPALA